MLLAARPELHSRAVAVHHPDDAGAVGAGGIRRRSHRGPRCRRHAARDRERRDRRIAARGVLERIRSRACRSPSTSRPSIDGSIRSPSRSWSRKCRSRARATWRAGTPPDAVDAARHRALAEDRFTATAASGGRCHDQLYVELTAFPDATSLASLRDVGVTYVVVHTDDYGSRWRSVEEQIVKTPAFKLEHVEGERPRLLAPAADPRPWTLRPHFSGCFRRHSSEPLMASAIDCRASASDFPAIRACR